eukprot:CAMPEP_0179007404 /NCGR_PEP_ID=MMETSP0795-20121207/15143_1 /TAXON_ID=88552 /ORGANISM="Amoebophrya sp., Strain Ameob2" /LENGTH=317 /DNA_ID=CAMNT_0020702377 /DNA_START=284 /DNA_END=1234 /DNA_ORIENTATION=+
MHGRIIYYGINPPLRHPPSPAAAECAGASTAVILSFFPYPFFLLRQRRLVRSGGALRDEGLVANGIRSHALELDDGGNKTHVQLLLRKLRKTIPVVENGALRGSVRPALCFGSLHPKRGGADGEVDFAPDEVAVLERADGKLLAPCHVRLPPHADDTFSGDEDGLNSLDVLRARQLVAEDKADPVRHRKAVLVRAVHFFSEANAVSVSVAVPDAVLAEGGEQVVVGSSLDEDSRLVLEPPHAQRFLVPNQPLLHPLHALRGHHLRGLHVPLPGPDDRPDRGTVLSPDGARFSPSVVAVLAVGISFSAVVLVGGRAAV